MRRKGKYLLLLGMMICCIPVIGRCYTGYRQQQLYDTYLQKQYAEVIQSPVEAVIATEGDAVEVARPTAQKVVDVPTLYTDNGVEVIGFLKLPKIDLEVMVVEGQDPKALRYAAGHMTDTALPGEVGNCSIAGHRNYTFGEYFNRLDELEVGDTIEIMYNGKQYTYEVYEKFIVAPEQMEVLDPQEGEEKVVTLITCHPIVIATHRLIVRGRLVGTVGITMQ